MHWSEDSIFQRNCPWHVQPSTGFAFWQASPPKSTSWQCSRITRSFNSSVLSQIPEWWVTIHWQSTGISGAQDTYSLRTECCQSSSTRSSTSKEASSSSLHGCQRFATIEQLASGHLHLWLPLDVPPSSEKLGYVFNSLCRWTAWNLFSSAHQETMDQRPQHSFTTHVGTQPPIITSPTGGYSNHGCLRTWIQLLTKQSTTFFFICLTIKMLLCELSCHIKVFSKIHYYKLSI